ncbi:MAG: GAF domain-containing protein, partial [Gemmataceae bacterium]|nr:GAF domain-containing protein [Gemmataceae bacterium]
MTGAARIILTGLGPKVAGLRWESDRTLRIGRIAAAEVMLRDHTVDRLHAEVKRTGDKWLIRDLAENELFPTLVNGAALLGSQRELRDRDVIQIGKLLFKVTLTTAAVAEASASGDSSRLEPVHDLDGLGGPSHSNHPSGLLAARRLIAKTNESSAAGECLRTSCAELQIQAVTHQSWDEALANVANDRSLLPNQAMLTLLRANHHLSNLSDLQQLLQSILADAVKSFDAQGGAILLFHPTAETLEPTVVLAPRLPTPRKGYSKTLSERCFRRGESLLCCDVSADQSLAQVSSVKHGAMASVLCALLRTPRRKLGVLHLDRGPFQEPFTESELYLADAVAASVAIGIECAQVVAQQREQFIDTVASLARAVEMRDQYTGDHTRRVTDYALLLADELQVPPAARYQLQIGTPLHDIGKIGI